ncbi:Hypothetical predicted protein [Octopus vulgaris]|uniref:Lysophospholipid acyltransferase 5 n=1 Tax=Octopus vulgaris TaxID=6645 RepID=A0AA36BW38_OCTVU|nr:Hypothetical predicted protein [Octopus vulgaris]
MSVSDGGTWAKVSEVFRGDSAVKALASGVGVPDDSVRMFLSLLAGYPLAFMYRGLLYGRSSTLQHIYFIICGVYMGYFNFGIDVLHSFVNLILIYLLTRIGAGRWWSLPAAFLINTGYLVLGFASSSKNGEYYRIEWTTSHCVLILKLTGVVADLYDGSKPEEKLSPDQKETAIKKTPTILELMGHCYFFGAFLIGPQCSIRRYLTLVKGGFAGRGDKVPNSVAAGLTKLIVGLFYILTMLILMLITPTDYFFIKDFYDLFLPIKCLYIIVWGRYVLSRYIACWHISEGICILTGLPYNGEDEKGNPTWNSMENIKLYEFETSFSLYGLTKAFNVQTSTWMVKYLMKRLRFLGNKELSKFITFAYLALWHGLYTGYFNTFFLEFMMITAETFILSRLKGRIGPLPSGRLNSVWLWVFFRLFYCQFFWGYALVSFELLQFKKYMMVYSSFQGQGLKHRSKQL